MKLGVLTVTFNRLPELQRLLNIYDGDTAIDQLVIVNNNSNDGTKEYLDSLALNLRAVKIFHLEENTGGSGGFHYGLNYMKDLDLDWIYLSDDDAFPEGKFFSEFRKRVSGLDVSKISAICSSVINNDEFDLYHRRNIKKRWFLVKEIQSQNADYEKEEFKIDLFSYVGVFINNKKLSFKNLPEKDYFIFYDDTEHSLQLLKKGIILCWPGLKVHHNSINNSAKYSWKHFYGIRNRLHTYKKHFGKASFFYLYFRYYLSAIFFQKNKAISKLQIEAINSAKQDLLGTHKIYKPGWVYKE